MGRVVHLKPEEIITTWRLPGVYACTICNNIEPMEREVKCWACGQGEMVWITANMIAELVQKKPPVAGTEG